MEAGYSRQTLAADARRPKRRKGDPLLARLSVRRRPLTAYPCAVWNGSGGRVCGMYRYASDEGHQKGPAAFGSEERNAWLAISKRLLRLFGFAPGAVPSSSLMCSLRYCQTRSQGKSRSDFPVAACRAAAKSTG